MYVCVNLLGLDVRLGVGGGRRVADLGALPGVGGALEVGDEAEREAAVDEELGGVELARDAELGGGVVVGVLVVPVVPALADGGKRDDGVLRGPPVSALRVGEQRGDTRILWRSVRVDAV